MIGNIAQLIRTIIKKRLNATPTATISSTRLQNGTRELGDLDADGRTSQLPALADHPLVDVATLAAPSRRTALQPREPDPHLIGETDSLISVVPRNNNSCPEDLLRLELEAELSAEEYFRQLQGEAASGHFVPIGRVSFSHEDTDWDVGDLLSEVPQLPATKAKGETPANRLRGRKAVSSSRSPSPLRVSVDQLYAEVDSLRWLSPKSRSALGKLRRGASNLTRPELNALDYLLSRAASISRLAPDIERILGHIADKHNGTR